MLNGQDQWVAGLINDTSSDSSNRDWYQIGTSPHYYGKSLHNIKEVILVGVMTVKRMMLENFRYWLKQLILLLLIMINMMEIYK